MTPIANSSKKSFTASPLMKYNSSTQAQDERIFHMNNRSNEDILEPNESQSRPVSSQSDYTQDEDQTPKFEERKNTAVFGSFAQMTQNLANKS